MDVAISKITLKARKQRNKKLTGMASRQANMEESDAFSVRAKLVGLSGDTHKVKKCFLKSAANSKKKVNYCDYDAVFLIISST